MNEDRDAGREEAGREERRVARGGEIYVAGGIGPAWRVVSGTVRLDELGAEGRQFAGLALPGDVIGAETLLFGRYSFTAVALAPCVIEPWLAGHEQPSGETLLGMLATTERRMARILSLRSGSARERIGRLLAFMSARVADGRRAVSLALPRLRDMAEITDLSIETVSRTITHLGAEGALEVHGRYRRRQVSATSGRPVKG